MDKQLVLPTTPQGRAWRVLATLAWAGKSTSWEFARVPAEWVRDALQDLARAQLVLLDGVVAWTARKTMVRLQGRVHVTPAGLRAAAQMPQVHQRVLPLSAIAMRSVKPAECVRMAPQQPLDLFGGAP